MLTLDQSAILIGDEESASCTRQQASLVVKRSHRQGDSKVGVTESVWTSERASVSVRGPPVSASAVKTHGRGPAQIRHKVAR